MSVCHQAVKSFKKIEVGVVDVDVDDGVAAKEEEEELLFLPVDDDDDDDDEEEEEVEAGVI